jgi:hypothetical protein
VLTQKEKGDIIQQGDKMEITEKEYAKIEPHLPIQRGNVEIANMVFLNALLYAIENGCKWQKMPK